MLNPEGLRFADEFVRHKVLDAIGDLALAGLPLVACYRTVRGGHKLNHAVLSALMADRQRLAGGGSAGERAGAARARPGASRPGLAPAYGPECPEKTRAESLAFRLNHRLNPG